jgi:hypothetical protein
MRWRRRRHNRRDRRKREPARLHRLLKLAAQRARHALVTSLAARGISVDASQILTVYDPATKTMRATYTPPLAREFVADALFVNDLSPIVERTRVDKEPGP